ncbi:MAG: CCA tRNA nucleotidyltransferase [Acidobacteria bacterium]|nr:CCA tRNA nucleotidyltransferase [Acidobacteriota bacterium]
MTAPTFRILLQHRAVRALAAACGETECHLVGGCLRDRALGLPSHDVDAVVAGRGREIAERLAAALPARLVLLGGKDFAAYRLVGQDLTLDLWDRAGTTLLADLARRDFTVNSFALGVRDGLLADPFGGLADLGRRILRATTPASFTGDPLRVLRLPRLSLRLPGFAADPPTFLLARGSSPRLVDVAAERVRDELAILFEHPEAHRGLGLLVALDLYPGLWLGAPGEPGRPGGAVTELEAIPERCRELRELDPEAASHVEARAARLAATFAHLPVRAGRGSRDFLELFRDAGYLTRQAAAEVALLLAEEEIPEDELGRRRFLHRTGRLWATVAVSLGARTADAARWRAAVRPLVDLARREGALLLDPPRLITGEEVQRILGIAPGPEVGRALAAVRQAQVDGQVRTREEAVAMLNLGE